ncbi:hypothetical protein RND81_06G060600 [Saponaria officinalis]|uniref:Uncharacterized protein n=1 Tax=Saponaria officinalis TaxID=3572 RepID=A0AAW1K826_SAPOF
MNQETSVINVQLKHVNLGTNHTKHRPSRSGSRSYDHLPYPVLTEEDMGPVTVPSITEYEPSTPPPTPVANDRLFEIERIFGKEGSGIRPFEASFVIQEFPGRNNDVGFVKMCNVKLLYVLVFVMGFLFGFFVI